MRLKKREFALCSPRVVLTSILIRVSSSWRMLTCVPGVRLRLAHSPLMAVFLPYGLDYRDRGDLITPSTTQLKDIVSCTSRRMLQDCRAGHETDYICGHAHSIILLRFQTKMALLPGHCTCNSKDSF